MKFLITCKEDDDDLTDALPPLFPFVHFFCLEVKKLFISSAIFPGKLMLSLIVELLRLYM